MILQPNQETKQVNVCPAANISYIGSCTNYKCPANLTNLTQAKQSGCIHLKLKIITLSGLSETLEIPEKEIKSQYSAGIKSIEKIVAFVNQVNLIREQAREKGLYYCANCGIRRPGKDDCLNKIRCNSRRKFANKVLRKYPLSIPTMSCSCSDFWAVMQLNKTIFSESIQRNAEKHIKGINNA